MVGDAAQAEPPDGQAGAALMSATAVAADSYTFDDMVLLPSQRSPVHSANA